MSSLLLELFISSQLFYYLEFYCLLSVLGKNRRKECENSGVEAFEGSEASKHYTRPSGFSAKKSYPVGYCSAASNGQRGSKR